ncbi:DUF1217 domain-containing protein [bacterium]|nr:DUF1217 domain-containing protein [bacterium]
MTYTPVLPLSGYAGWTLLNRTMTAQTTAFNNSPEIKRDEDYFLAKIGTVKTADQLVNDRRLLKVALGAFGLDSDIDNKAFIKKVLTDGTVSSSALANRLSDKRYQQLSAAFGFDLGAPSTQLSDFGPKIVAAYKSREFESAVGDQDQDLRLALDAQREITSLANKSSSDATKWYTILGSTPLTTVFQKALGLPSSVGSLNLDQQLGIYQSKLNSVFGSGGISQFADPAKLDALVKKFLVRSQADQLINQSSGTSIALTLLQQSGAPNPLTVLGG